MMMSVAYYILRNHADAEDAVQTAFLLAFTHSDQLRNENDGSTPAWLRMITYRACYDIKRGWNRRSEVQLYNGEDEVDGYTNPLLVVIPEWDSDMDRRELAQKITKKVGTAKNSQQRIIRMVLYEGKGYPEIAREVGMTQSGAKAIYFRWKNAVIRDLKRRGLASCPVASPLLEEVIHEVA